MTFSNILLMSVPIYHIMELWKEEPWSYRKLLQKDESLGSFYQTNEKPEYSDSACTDSKRVQESTTKRGRPVRLSLRCSVYVGKKKPRFGHSLIRSLVDSYRSLACSALLPRISFGFREKPFSLQIRSCIEFKQFWVAGSQSAFMAERLELQTVDF